MLAWGRSWQCRLFLEGAVLHFVTSQWEELLVIVQLFRRSNSSFGLKRLSFYDTDPLMLQEPPPLVRRRGERGGAKPSDLSGLIQICDWLESFIDPFDLDVFTPSLNANLTRLTQRTSVLLGLLMGPEKQFSARSSPVNSSEPYNILPLASSQLRSEVNAVRGSGSGALVLAQGH
uniref:Conserved oligomeric Golgi complex subunit 1 n=1 Tax=Oryzias sinensis TaxID=183150 RepID=A0A8C7Z7D9_9TELE